MAKKGRHRKGGRTTPKGTRPLHAVPSWTEPTDRFDHFDQFDRLDPIDLGSPIEPPPDAAAAQFFDGLLDALREPSPSAFLGVASTLFSLVDPRRRDPLDRAPETESVTLESLLEPLMGTDRTETTALLTAFASFTSDADTRDQIRAVLRHRRHTLPAWLGRLDGIEVKQAVEMVHLLGDGDNHLLDVQVPGGEPFTLVAYVDHNVGTIVKDAYVIPATFDEAFPHMQALADDPHTTFDPVSLADVRARLTAAIDTGARTYPPYETDTWPALRPLLELLVRRMPSGGTGYTFEPPSEADQALLEKRFFASPFAKGVSSRDHRSLLESILWFGSGYNRCDPMRWSPVNVEILLVDWFPRKIVADAPYLAKMPKLLRAFIRYCHDARGVPPELTTETLTSVDRWEPEYHRLIRSNRPQGVDAIFAAMGFDTNVADHRDAEGELDDERDEDAEWDTTWDEIEAIDDPEERERRFDEMVKELVRSRVVQRVGSEDALRSLTDAPLPDEPFDWTGIPDDVHESVTAILTISDRCCDELLDVEYRTACRRLLARAAAGNPALFRRKARADYGAAAIVWTICGQNDQFTKGAAIRYVKDLMAWFGVGQGRVSPRAATLLEAAGYARSSYFLGDPTLLVSATRRSIIDWCEQRGIDRSVPT